MSLNHIGTVNSASDLGILISDSDGAGAAVGHAFKGIHIPMHGIGTVGTTAIGYAKLYGAAIIFIT
tara:strand:- start:207 stop:404 length:198 start_codon:yes stop_codon:yes gene_type:complete